MTLSVLPIAPLDISQCVSIRIASLGSLVIGHPPPYRGYQEEQIASIRKDLEERPYVHHLKVVNDDDKHRVMAYAKWEVYKTGRPDLDKLSRPLDPSDLQVDQYEALRAAAHDYFSHRNSEMGKNPHILLALLVTAKDFRQRGAGSLLVQWGIELSEIMGLPCYLQASEQGRRLYQHRGFKELDTVEFDLAKFGFQGVERMTEMLRAPTGRNATGQAEKESLQKNYSA